MTLLPGTFIEAAQDDSAVYWVEQQSVDPFWIGGHGADPYEQNTQQSPFCGVKVSPQPRHL